MYIRPEELMNYFIYTTPSQTQPTRYELIRYSTWRIYLYQQLQILRTEQMPELRHKRIQDKFPKLVSNSEQEQFYGNLLIETKSQKTARQDNISHFICRMLYCNDPNNHSKFVQMQKNILSTKLFRKLNQNSLPGTRVIHMNFLKRLVCYFLQINVTDLNVTQEQWAKYSTKIMYNMHSKNHSSDQYIKVPLEFGEYGLKKRYCFVHKGTVFLNIEATTDLVVNLYAAFLKSKLEKLRGPVNDMLNSDTENQMSSFLLKTLDTLNKTNFDQSTITAQFKINSKNIESLWRKFFPPCMINLVQKLKQHSHLKHQGRRQLWLFLKGCGMDAHDNQQYFSRHFYSKVSASDLKNHMYNIQHAYGLVGKKQPERPKNCRSIITGPAPKKDQHHGCPFAHWRKEDLREFLKRNYNVSDAHLDEIIRQKQQNHFQVACGRLFEGSMKPEKGQIPPQITNLLGKSPHEYFQAGMKLINSQSMLIEF